MKIGLVGGVNSSFATLKKLYQHELNIVHVFGFRPAKTGLVSGYHNFAQFCDESGIEYTPFAHINDHTDEIRQADLDVLFVVGLSQLISQDIINAPRLGCVGFHPTDLPRGRGRAPIAWLTERVENGAACFFQIYDGEADSGPIFVKRPYTVDAVDDAQAVETKCLSALDSALDEWLPKLKQGQWNPVPQEESLATEYGVRKPEDGYIDWHRPAKELVRLIRAAAPPHPGAFCYFGLEKMVINKASLERKLQIIGCVGRVLKVVEKRLLVQTGDGLLWLDDFQLEKNSPRVGARLGYIPEIEINKLKHELLRIKHVLSIADG